MAYESATNTRAHHAISAPSATGEAFRDVQQRVLRSVGKGGGGLNAELQDSAVRVLALLASRPLILA